MEASNWRDTFARAMGFAAAWAVFSGVLLLASRLMGWGPGFSNPLPYILIAISLAVAGRMIRGWLGHLSAPKASSAGGPSWSLRRLGGQWFLGLRDFFRSTAAVNNFLFLSAAFFFGVGLSRLFTRAAKKNPSAATYWQDLNLGKREADAYYRPF